MAITVLRMPAVQLRTGLSKATIYLRVKEGNFPKPIKLGARAVGWIEDDINEWLDHQVELSGAHTPDDMTGDV